MFTVAQLLALKFMIAVEGSIDSIHPFAKMTWILVKYPFRNFTSSGQRNSLSLHLFDIKFVLSVSK